MEAIKGSMRGNIVMEAVMGSMKGNIVMEAVKSSIWGNIVMGAVNSCMSEFYLRYHFYGSSQGFYLR